MPTPVLPLDFIGPDAIGRVALPIGPGSVDVYTPIQGEKTQTRALLPPDIKMSDTMRQALNRYLESELNLCEGERSAQIKKLARLKKKYRVKTPTEPKDWPIANASQITIPVIKSTVNTLKSRIFQTIAAADPLARVKTDDNAYKDFTFDWEQFLKIYSTQKLCMDDILDTAIHETVLLGTSVLEVATFQDRKNQVTFDPLSGGWVKKMLTTYSGPKVFNIPLEDFWMRPNWTDPQTAPWCGKLVRMSWSQVKDAALAGTFDPDRVRELAHRFDQTVPDTILVDEDNEEARPFSRGNFNIFRLAVRWDVDGDGIEEDLLVYYSRDSRTILRCIYNGYPKMARPWYAMRYIKIPYRFYGEGVAEMLEALQDEISTIHNQRIDNATIANLRIILVAKMIQGLRPGDRLWSGKIVKVTDTKTDVGTLQLGDIYPSTILNENQAQQYASEVSGMGDVGFGQAQPVTRTTAAAQLSLLEELNRRYVATIKGMRKTVSDVYGLTCGLFYQQGTGGLAEQWLGEFRGQRIEAYLAIPPDQLDEKVKIQVESTSATNNREVDFQSQIAVMNLIMQMGDKMIQLTQGLAPNALGIVAHEIISAVRPVFKNIMEYAGAPDPEQAIAVLNVLERILPDPEDMGGMANARKDEMASLAAGNGSGGPQGANARANGSAPAAAGPGGMADFAAALRQAAGRQ